MCHFERSAPVSGGDGTTFEEIAVPGDDIMLPGFLALPVDRKAPVVLIIHDVTGASPFYQDLARRLANAGFAALLPDFFVREGAPEDETREAIMKRASLLDQPTTLNDITHVVNWLNAEQSGRIGILGFCMGGTLAMLAAGREPMLAAAAAYYGFPLGRPGWPYVPLENVKQLRAPLLTFWGDQDHSVGMENVDAWTAAVRAAEKDVETVIYPGLPHGFLTFDPSSPHYESAHDSWIRTLAFFAEKFGA